jgi:hypothetical protein
VTKPLDAFRHRRFEHLAIIVIAEDRLTAVSPQHSMVQGSG